MLEEALELTARLLQSDTHCDFQGEFYQLDDAILLPRPARPGGPPILIGGSGPKKTLPLAAKYAAEWNAAFISLDTYAERKARMVECLEQEGRAADDIKYSLMTRVTYRPSDAQLDAHLHEQGLDAADLKARGLIVGTGSEVVDQLGQWVEAGVERFMLQWVELDDMENLELLARDVLAAFSD